MLECLALRLLDDCDVVDDDGERNIVRDQAVLIPFFLHLPLCP